MPRTLVTVSWERIAARQEGIVTRRQLNLLGHDRSYVRTQLRARRWREVTPTVLATERRARAGCDLREDPS